MGSSLGVFLQQGYIRTPLLIKQWFYLERSDSMNSSTSATGYKGFDHHAAFDVHSYSGGDRTPQESAKRWLNYEMDADRDIIRPISPPGTKKKANRTRSVVETKAPPIVKAPLKKASTMSVGDFEAELAHAAKLEEARGENLALLERCAALTKALETKAHEETSKMADSVAAHAAARAAAKAAKNAEAAAVTEAIAAKNSKAMAVKAAERAVEDARKENIALLERCAMLTEALEAKTEEEEAKMREAYIEASEAAEKRSEVALRQAEAAALKAAQAAADEAAKKAVNDVKAENVALLERYDSLRKELDVTKTTLTTVQSLFPKEKAKSVEEVHALKEQEIAALHALKEQEVAAVTIKAAAKIKAAVKIKAKEVAAAHELKERAVAEARELKEQELAKAYEQKQKEVAAALKEATAAKEDAAAVKAMEREEAQKRWREAMHKVATEATKARAAAAADIAAAELAAVKAAKAAAEEAADHTRRLSLQKAVSAKEAALKAATLAAAKADAEAAAMDAGARRLQGTWFTRKSSKEFEEKRRASRVMQKRARKHALNKLQKRKQSQSQRDAKFRMLMTIAIICIVMAIAVAAGVATAKASGEPHLVQMEAAFFEYFSDTDPTPKPASSSAAKTWIYFGSAAAAPLVALARAIPNLLVGGTPVAAAAAQAAGGGVPVLGTLAVGGAAGGAKLLAREIARKAAMKAAAQAAAPAFKIFGLSLGRLGLLITPGIGSLLGVAVSAFL